MGHNSQSLRQKKRKKNLHGYFSYYIFAVTKQMNSNKKKELHKTRVNNGRQKFVHTLDKLSKIPVGIYSTTQIAELSEVTLQTVRNNINNLPINFSVSKFGQDYMIEVKTPKPL